MSRPTLARVPNRRRTARRLVLEALESRQLLSNVTVSVNPTTISEASINPAVFDIHFDGTGATGQETISFKISGSPANVTPGVDYTLKFGGQAISMSSNGDGSYRGSIQVGYNTQDAPISFYPLDDARLQGLVEDVTLTLGGITGSGSDVIGLPNAATLTVDDGNAPPPPPAGVDPLSGSGLINLLPSAAGSDGGDPGSRAISPSGVNYATGAVTNVATEGVVSDGFGTNYGQVLGWSNLRGYQPGTDPYGSGMVDAGLPVLEPTLSSTEVRAILSVDQSLWFTGAPATGPFTGFGFNGDTLTASGSNLVLTGTEGDQTTFYGFGNSVAPALQGQFLSSTDPGGNAITASYNQSNQLATVTRTDGTNTQTFTFSYVTGSGNPNAGMLAGVSLSQNGTVVRQAVYTYYGTGDANGSPGDLEFEQVEDGSGSVIDTSYFRYYTSSSSDLSTHGYLDGLKYWFSPQSYDRAAAALGNLTTATDAQVAPYADAYYQYDPTSQRVTQAVIQGAGGGSGQGTYSYAYASSSNSQGFNNWQTKTVETLPDGNTNTVYANYAGEMLLTDFKDTSDPNNPALQGKDWLTLDQYDSQGRLIEEAEPSAITGYSDAVANLSPALNTTGLVHVYDYATSTTATSTTASDVAGYRKDEKIQQGSNTASAILLESWQYLTHGSGTTEVFPQATDTVYRNTDGSGGETTSDSYTWSTAGVGDMVQSVTETLPAATAAENGSGTADVSATDYDSYGRPQWTKDGDGFLTYTAYDDLTGAVTSHIDDVQTSNPSDFTNLPSGWSTPSTGGANLVTAYQVDLLGRPTKTTDANGHITYTVYLDTQHEMRTYVGWNTSTNVPTVPTEVMREDRAGGYTETLTMTAAPHLTNNVPDGTEAISSIQSLERDLTDLSFRPSETDRYVSLSGITYSTTPQLGTVGTNYYATTYGYDVNSNLQRTVDAVGTITDTYHDSLSRPTSVYVGTNDDTGSSNMVETAAYQYDGNGVGDGKRTQETDYPGGSAAARVTASVYDWRDRLVATKSGVQTTEDTTTHRPILFYIYDNRDEVTSIAQYDGDGVTLSTTPPNASLLRAYTTTAYDEQGRVYQTKQYDVNQVTGAYSAGLVDNLFYNHRGLLMAESAPGGLWTKYYYDGLGRLVTLSHTDGAGGSTWGPASALSGDNVLEQLQYVYDGVGNVVLQTTKERDDNETTKGSLSTETSPPKSRVYYVASYYDAANRLTASVNVGDNGGTLYTRPYTVPSRSDTALVTSDVYTYGLNGTPGLTVDETDPRGIDTRTTSDMLGRTTQTIDDYTNGTPTASSNQTTNYTYNGIGDVLTEQAVMPSGTPSQTTGYVYGVTTAGGSNINSNDLLATLQYPDATTGNPSTSASNEESYTYNALGDETSLTQPTGTVHSNSYDVLGRPTSDTVTTMGTGVDGSVRRIDTAYDAGDRPYLFTSYADTAGTQVVNQVEETYNGLGQLTGEYQENQGAVNLSTSFEVQYAYNEMAGGQNNSRPVGMTYPNGRKIDYVYNAGVDATISRLSAIADDNNGSPGTTLEAYTYLGLDTVVQRDHPEAGVMLTYIQQTGQGNVNTDGGDRYTGLDRFGRVIDQNWIKDGTTNNTDRFQYAYDRAGNVLYQNNLVNPSQSELYRPNSTVSGDSNTAYDALGRMIAFARGALSSSGNNGTQLDTIASPNRAQSWTLDALGNWSAVSTNGTPTNRTFNAQNQTSGVTYDADGNTTGDSGWTYTYDAWDRLKSAANGTQLVTYAYDVLGRRIEELTPSVQNHLYYDSSWQVVEERDANTGLSKQYVWSAAGADTLMLRDDFASNGTTRLDRYYAQTDANGDVTAIIDTTGTVQERYEYDPYGAVSYFDANWNARASSSYGWQVLHQGLRLDATTGWYYDRARDLISSEGHFAERDPLGLDGGDVNLYRYVGNAPVGYMDSSGLQRQGGTWPGPFVMPPGVPPVVLRPGLPPVVVVPSSPAPITPLPPLHSGPPVVPPGAPPVRPNPGWPPTTFPPLPPNLSSPRPPVLVRPGWIFPSIPPELIPPRPPAFVVPGWPSTLVVPPPYYILVPRPPLGLPSPASPPGGARPSPPPPWLPGNGDRPEPPAPWIPGTGVLHPPGGEWPPVLLEPPDLGPLDIPRPLPRPPIPFGLGTFPGGTIVGPWHPAPRGGGWFYGPMWHGDNFDPVPYGGGVGISY
jgi:RHS repeat-associated protein